MFCVFVFKQKTAYEMRISDWSSDVCSSDLAIYPAKHFVTSEDRMVAAIESIETELAQRLKELRDAGGILEAARLEERTKYDLETLREVGYCSGIENYSRHLAGRDPGSTPWTLLDYFPDDWRSEEHTSELQYLMRISYAVFCLKK